LEVSTEIMKGSAPFSGAKVFVIMNGASEEAEG